MVSTEFSSRKFQFQTLSSIALAVGLIVGLKGADGFLGSSLHDDPFLTYGASLYLSSLCVAQGGACNAVCLFGEPSFFCNSSATCCVVRGSQQILQSPLGLHGLGPGGFGHGLQVRGFGGNGGFGNRRKTPGRRGKFHKQKTPKYDQDKGIRELLSRATAQSQRGYTPPQNYGAGAGRRRNPKRQDRVSDDLVEWFKVLNNMDN